MSGFKQVSKINTDDEIPRAKKDIKKSIEAATLEMWNQKVENLTMQGDFTNLLIHEKENVTWQSVIKNVPRGIMSFALNSVTNTLPSPDNLKRWGNIFTQEETVLRTAMVSIASCKVFVLYHSFIHCTLRCIIQYKCSSSSSINNYISVLHREDITEKTTIHVSILYAQGIATDLDL